MYHDVSKNFIKWENLSFIPGRVQQLGVADVGGGCLRKLHAWARVKPTIAQINLASCCVVPPSLHAFCKANDVQLLTHADPPGIFALKISCISLIDYMCERDAAIKKIEYSDALLPSSKYYTYIFLLSLKMAFRIFVRTMVGNKHRYGPPLVGKNFFYKRRSYC